MKQEEAFMENMVSLELGIVLKKDIAMVSSRDVARVFEKRHDDVLKAIRVAK